MQYLLTQEEMDEHLASKSEPDTDAALMRFIDRCNVVSRRDAAKFGVTVVHLEIELDELPNKIKDQLVQSGRIKS